MRPFPTSSARKVAGSLARPAPATSKSSSSSSMGSCRCRPARGSGSSSMKTRWPIRSATSGAIRRPTARMARPSIGERAGPAGISTRPSISESRMSMSPAPFSSMVGAQQAQHQAQPLTRRRLIAVAAGSAGAFGAAACSGIGSQSAKPAATLNQPASLVWLNWEGGASQLEGNTKTIEDFQARYPQIKVENAAQTTTGNYWDKHAALTAAGTPADLWEWEPQNVVDYVLRKQALDLQPLVARDRFDLSDFFKKGVDQYRWRGGLWGLPRDFPNRELFYNVTEFQKNGVTLPASDWKNPSWTWDAFLDAARRVTKPDGSQIGFNTGRGIRMWAVWVWANGGEVIDESKLECTLDRQPAIDALQFLQDLIHKHRVMAATLPPGASFAGGQVIINENAPAGLGNTRRDVAD